MSAGRWRRSLVGMAVGLATLLGALVGLAWWADGADADAGPTVPSTPASGPAAGDAVARGAYLARLGHCAGCHTARGGAPYAGGRALHTPFGTVYAGNLTPDIDTGLGRWTAQDFWRALHHGRSRDGRRLVPAFPYTAFTRITRADSDALFAYLRALPAVAQATPPHALRFPYNTQLALGVWRALFFRPGVQADEVMQPAAWNRGAYLVQGLGHCSACHAPRNMLGASASSLSGGVLPDGRWWAPPLPDAADPADPAAAARHIVELLRTGRSDVGSASGPMAEVVFGSTQHWRDEDLHAVATYLLAPPRPARDADTAAPASSVQHEQGRSLYDKHCADCHGLQGEGVAKVYPPLAGNPSVLQPDARNLVRLLDHGSFAPATASNPRPYSMPAQALGDAEAAAVLSYVRQSWGNQASALSEVRVLMLR